MLRRWFAPVLLPLALLLGACAGDDALGGFGLPELESSDRAEVLTGTGALVSLDDLPGGENPDSYFASFGTFCGADERGVLVLEDAATAD